MVAVYLEDDVVSWADLEAWNIGAGMNMCLLTSVRIYSDGPIILCDRAYLSIQMNDNGYVQEGF